MNERIRQLAEQAGMALKPRRPYDDKEPDGYLESDLDYLENNLEATRMFFEGGLEKFALLIVAECISVMKSTVDESIDFDRKPPETSSWIESDIKEHFGVEELDEMVKGVTE